MQNGGDFVQNKKIMQKKGLEELVGKRLKPFLPLLVYLAYNREATIDDIAKEVGKDYTTILRALRHLIKRDFVRLSRLERTSEKGREKRYYQITIYGLEFLLGLYHDFTGNLPDIRRIAEAHQDMLLSFAKWQKFVEAGCERICVENLKEAIRAGSIVRYVLAPLSWGFYPISEKDQWTRKTYDWMILGFRYMYMPRKYAEEYLSKKGLWEQLLKLWQIVGNDYDLRRLQEEFIFMMERESKEILKSIQEWRTFWHEHLMKEA